MLLTLNSTYTVAYNSSAVSEMLVGPSSQMHVVWTIGAILNYSQDPDISKDTEYLMMNYVCKMM